MALVLANMTSGLRYFELTMVSALEFLRDFFDACFRLDINVDVDSSEAVLLPPRQFRFVLHNILELGKHPGRTDAAAGHNVDSTMMMSSVWHRKKANLIVIGWEIIE